MNKVPRMQFLNIRWKIGIRINVITSVYQGEILRLVVLDDRKPLSTIRVRLLVVRSSYLRARVNPAGPEPMTIESYD